jgi:outer membrane protein OmpA-like peptidoglycan-associated protein
MADDDVSSPKQEYSMKIQKVWMALSLLSATTAAAQQPGVVEVGAFGRWSHYDATYQADANKFIGGGGRLGVFVLPQLAIEVDQYYTKFNVPTGSASHYPLHARLVYNLPLSDNSAILIGAGYVRNFYRGVLNYEDNGYAGLLGLRLGLNNVVSIRLEGTADFMPNPAIQQAYATNINNWNYGAQAGLSVLIGNEKKVRDSDGDGVLDNIDACPNTPKGDAVDAKGCSLPKDADNDGVLDNVDQCPNTPAGDKVDAKGCSLPKDGDKDGVMDDKDKCPNTPAGDKVDANGCSLPKDSDADGVTDDKDRCPNTPAGDKVDANGCSLPKDSDGDGVTDDKDRCPNTPAGTQVDAVGCRILFEGASKALVLEGVEFELNKSTLTDNAKTILDNVASSLVANTDVKVEVTGHTDNTGSAALNKRLSAARAKSVYEYLGSKGVAASQLTGYKGFGPSKPVDTNKTAEGRAKNRRVELDKVN